jgi:hypothetical protein
MMTSVERSDKKALLQAFPLPGTFHFRFLRQVNTMTVWLDVTEDGPQVPVHNNCVTMKVVRINAGDAAPRRSGAVAASQPRPAATPVAAASAPAPARPPAAPVAPPAPAPVASLLSFDDADHSPAGRSKPSLSIA